MFFSNNTVVTHMELDPLIGGLSSGSIIIKPTSALGSDGGLFVIIGKKK